MDFLGIGILELLVILVVAFVVLGPARTVGMARSAGKAFGQVRRAMTDFSRAVEEEERELERMTEIGGEADFVDFNERRSPEERR